MNHPAYDTLLAHFRRQSDRLDFGTPPLPLLVTGVTGVAGYNALAYFQSRFPDKVFGLLAPDDGRFPAPNALRAETTRFDELERLFEKYRFASVLDCAGNCALKACQLDPKIAWSLNVEIIRHLAILTRRRGVRLVHLSVDMVFGGRSEGGYRDDEPPSPVNVYGQTMAEGEKTLTEEDPYAATLRISMPMGLSFNGHAGAIDWIASRFIAGRPATLYYDEVRTPTYTDDLSRVTRAVLASDFAGILNAGGPRPVSLYQMAQIINRLGGFSPDLLFGLMKDESCPVPPRVSNCSMNSEKLAAVLGFEPFRPWPLDDEHFPTDRKWHRQRAPHETGSVERMNRLLAFLPPDEKAAKAGCY